MEITSTILCRANGNIYEGINVMGTDDNSILSLVYSTDLEQCPLPCELFEGPASLNSAGGRSFVVVCPILPIEEAFYTIGEFDQAGRMISSTTRHINFSEAKWRSRLNYRLHKNQCEAVRLYEEKTLTYGETVLSFLAAISTSTHIIIRGTVSWPDLGNNRLNILCANDRLECIANSFITMGSTTEDSPIPGTPKTYSLTFSVKVPWNQGDIFFYVWNGHSPKQNINLTLSKAEYESMLDKSNRLLYRDASRDPYYAEWFRKHRATPYTLDMQRGASLPIKPLFSIIVPLYRTPIDLFNEMVTSVLSQTYSVWELILVNATPEDDKLSSCIADLCGTDNRVRCVQLKENYGISLNTNEGIRLAKGDFVSFFDHDDLLEPDILFEYAYAINRYPDIDLLYCDEDKLMPDGTYVSPYFKPDFSIDLLRNNNYICHMLTIRHTLLNELEPNTAEFDGAQDHNITLQAVERARRVHHIPKILYHWRVTPSSTASSGEAKPYATMAGIKAVEAHLNRLGINATVSRSDRPFTYNVRYSIPNNNPLISIIIPNKDQSDMLIGCIESIIKYTTYDNYEIIIVENNSQNEKTFKCYESLHNRYPTRIKVVQWKYEFNFSKICNFGRTFASGEYLLFLNNDTEVITPDWLSIMLGICSRNDVGIVGPKLLYPDDTIQHAGVVLSGDFGHLDHLFKNLPDESIGYFAFADAQRNLSAVTGACMMTKSSVFDNVLGFTTSFEVAYNDIDYCLKVRSKNLLIVYAPTVKLYHFESVSRGFDTTLTEKIRLLKEKTELINRWASVFAAGDPYHSPNLRQSLPELCYYCF